MGSSPLRPLGISLSPNLALAGSHSTFGYLWLQRNRKQRSYGYRTAIHTYEECKIPMWWQ